MACQSQRTSCDSRFNFEERNSSNQPVFTWQFFVTVLLPVIMSPLLFVQDNEDADSTNGSPNNSNTVIRTFGIEDRILILNFVGQEIQ